MKKFQIAIDGPAGAGKSTIAKRLSSMLGFTYIDTGAMYRAVGLFAVSNGIDPKDGETLSNQLDKIDIDINYIDGVQHIILCGVDVTDKIRTPEMSMAASDVGKHKDVRLTLVDLQRKLAEKYDVIMDGRDIGTYVLKDADVKIFLTADVETRAGRRYKELTEKGENVTFDFVLNDMKQRDYNDSHREFAPLKKADDATEIDTTLLTFEESVEKLHSYITERLSI